MKNFNRLWAKGAAVALLNDTDITPIEKTKQLLPYFWRKTNLWNKSRDFSENAQVVYKVVVDE